MPTANFKVGEMLHKRTPNSKTWMNFDGSYTTEIHSGVVHFEDQNGNLQNVNTDLYDEADFDLIDEPVAAEGVERFKQAKTEAKAAKKQNVMNRAQHNFQALRVPFDAHIPRNFQRGYTIGKGQDKLTFKPVKSSPAMGELSQTDRSVIVYQDVWNDTDVELKVQPDGLKETLYLKTEKAPTSFAFEVKGKDIADDFTAGVLKLMPAWLMDAAGTYRDVDQQVVRKNDNKVYVELNADVTDLVYPIAIDPTVVIQPAAANGKDTYAYEYEPDRNFATGAQLVTGAALGSNTSGWSYLAFDLSTVPSGFAIEKVLMDLYCANVRYTGQPIHVHEVLEPWEATTLTWNNMPAMDPVSLTNQYVGSSSRWYSFDISTLAKKWFSGEKANNGVALINETLPRETNIYFASSNYATAAYLPKLSVTYNQPPPAPTVLVPNGGETWNSLHTIEWDGVKDALDDIVIKNLVSATSNAYLDPVTFSEGGQVFVPRGNVLTKLKFKVSSISTTAKARIKIYDVVNKLPFTLLYQSEPFDLILGDMTRLFEVPVTPGNNYAISVVAEEGSFQIEGFQSSNYSEGYRVSYRKDSNTWSEVSTADLNFTIGQYSDKLQYNIQLSIDNGGTWKDIVSLSQAGAIAQNYDFINEQETSTAKVRIRAYDGTSYGSWDESDGVFTIIHNQAPDAPMNLTPAGGQVRDRAKPIRLSWLHNDPNTGDPQSQFDVQWRPKGASSWITVPRVSTAQSFDLTGLSRGEHEWRVRTYDQAGLSSPYSDIALFFAGDKPSKATITNYTEGATVAVANPTIQWSSANQAVYKLNVKDAAGVIVWTDEKVSANKAVTANANLANQQAYSLELSIRNADGLWSDVTAISVNVSYTPPAIPVLTAAGDNRQALIRLAITNPVPSGTEPIVARHDLFRKALNESSWKRIANNVAVNGLFTDHTPAGGKTYQYYVRAWGENGTYRDSVIVQQAITLFSIWLMDPSDPDSLHRFHYFEPGRSAERNLQGQLMEFEGREQPMAEFSSREQRKVNVVLQFKKDSTDLEALDDLIGRRTTLLYRDAKGRRIYGSVFVLSENETDYGYTIPLEIQQVGYEEEV